MEITIEQAIQNIENLLEGVTATRAQHNALAESVRVIKEAAMPKQKVAP